MTKLLLLAWFTGFLMIEGCAHSYAPRTPMKECWEALPPNPPEVARPEGRKAREYICIPFREGE